MKRIVALLMMIGCGGSSAVKQGIKLDHAATVQRKNDAPVLLKKDEVIEIDGSPILVSAPGFVSTLVVPLREELSSVNVSLSPIAKEEADQKIEPKLNVVISQVLKQINEIQMLMGQEQTEEALRRIQSLGDKYPRVTYFKVLEASCLVLVGQRERAKAYLTQAAKEFPDDKDISNMLVALKEDAGNQ